MRSAALLSSNRQDWRTPEWFLDLVRQIGRIALDPASAPDNPTGAARFIYQGEGLTCGLAGEWTRDGLAFINPPYGAHLSGDVEPNYVHTRKCKTCDGRGTSGETDYGCGDCNGQGRVQTGVGRGWGERIARDRGEWLALVPTRTDATWWHRMHEACSWGVFWRSPEHGARINFVHPETGKPKPGSTLASSVFYHGPNVADFLGVFGPHGRPFPGFSTTLDLYEAALQLQGLRR